MLSYPISDYFDSLYASSIEETKKAVEITQFFVIGPTERKPLISGVLGSPCRQASIASNTLDSPVVDRHRVKWAAVRKTANE